MGNYSEAHGVLEYCGIGNIHVVRDSLKRLANACAQGRKTKWSDVTDSHWLDHISSILAGTKRIVHCVDKVCCSFSLALTHSISS